MPSATFPARFEFLDAIREFVADVARQHDFNDKEIYSLQLAADEAASNIIEHAYVGISDATFDMSCEMRGGAFLITMRDDGVSFDASSVQPPNIKADLSDRRIGGLGIYLMRKLMDEVRYEANTGNGNVLTMIKYKE